MSLRIVVQLPRNQIAQFIDGRLMKLLEEVGDVNCNPYDRQWTNEELQEQLASAEVCVSSWGSRPLTKEMLEAAGQLKLFVHMAGAVKPYIAVDAYDRGIHVLSGGHAIAVSVAESALALILASLHHVIGIDAVMHSGGWRPDEMEVRELRGKQIGLIGFGATAYELVKLLQPFGSKITAYDPHVKKAHAASMGVRLASLEQVLASSEIISLHLPKVPETYRMIGQEQLKLLPDGALLINTSRGSVMDEQALVKELRSGRIRAALDVYETEPLPETSELRKLSGVILRPHLAGVNQDSKRRIGEYMVEDIVRFSQGQPERFAITRQQLAFMT